MTHDATASSASPARPAGSDRPTDPQGHVFTITAGPYAAEVIGTGGGLRALTHDGVDLVQVPAVGEVVHEARGQLLVPWPNRVADGKYDFDGHSYQLSLSEPDRHNAIHGLTRWSTWDEVEPSGSDRVTLQHVLPGESGYPFSLLSTVRYTVSAATGLRVELETTNVGAHRAPYACGAHPYLDLGADVGEWTLDYAGEQVLLCDDERLLPTELVPLAGSGLEAQPGVPLGDRVLNHALTGLADPWSVTASCERTGRRAQIRSGSPWLQLYTGETIDRTALAVEPMSSPANTFASGNDLVVLEPGESHTLWYEIGLPA